MKTESSGDLKGRTFFKWNGGSDEKKAKRLCDLAGVHFMTFTDIGIDDEDMVTCFVFCDNDDNTNLLAPGWYIVRDVMDDGEIFTYSISQEEYYNMRINNQASKQGDFTND